MAATEDEETQKKGMVAVVVNMGKREKLHLEAVRMMPAIAQAIPIRFSALHFW
jgi:hypothetical protein